MDERSARWSSALLASRLPMQRIRRRPFRCGSPPPLGRTGLPGAIRIVAQSHPPRQSAALRPVQFLCERHAGAVPMPKARHSPSSGPTRIRSSDRIRVETIDNVGNAAADVVELAPFEIVEATAVSSVLLEVTVVDKATASLAGSTPPRSACGKRANFRPSVLPRRVAAGKLYAAGGRKPEHACTHGLRPRSRATVG